MQIEASRKLKVLYCVNYAQFSVIPLAYGVIMNIIWGMKLTPDYFGRAAVCLLLLILFGYRIYSVVRNVEALTLLSAHSFAKVIRAFSIFLMWVGVLAIPNLIVIVVIAGVFELPSLLGMGLIVPIWLGYSVCAGFIGFVLFETTRLITIWVS